jgi:hypothetical protein
MGEPLGNQRLEPIKLMGPDTKPKNATAANPTALALSEARRKPIWATWMTSILTVRDL